MHRHDFDCVIVAIEATIDGLAEHRVTRHAGEIVEHRGKPSWAAAPAPGGALHQFCDVIDIGEVALTADGGQQTSGITPLAECSHTSRQATTLKVVDETT